MSEIAACPLSPIADDPSSLNISHVLSLLQSVTLLASSIDAAPVCQLLHCTTVLFNQSCLTLCDPMDCSPPGSSVYGIFQARILEWVAISFSRRSSRPRDQTRVLCVAGRCFTVGVIYLCESIINLLQYGTT